MTMSSSPVPHEIFLLMEYFVQSLISLEHSPYFHYILLLLGSIYVEMISNLLEPILRNPAITFVRYNAFHNIPSGTNNFIGRAAHIAILDSELFVEKLILVSAAKYFK